jgi:hypothetical protein
MVTYTVHKLDAVLLILRMTLPVHLQQQKINNPTHLHKMNDLQQLKINNPTHVHKMTSVVTKSH